MFSDNHELPHDNEKKIFILSTKMIMYHITRKRKKNSHIGFLDVYVFRAKENDIIQEFLFSHTILFFTLSEHFKIIFDSFLKLFLLQL